MLLAAEKLSTDSAKKKKETTTCVSAKLLSMSADDTVGNRMTSVGAPRLESPVGGRVIVRVRNMTRNE